MCAQKNQANMILQHAEYTTMVYKKYQKYMLINENVQVGCTYNNNNHPPTKFKNNHLTHYDVLKRTKIHPIKRKCSRSMYI